MAFSCININSTKTVLILTNIETYRMDDIIESKKNAQESGKNEILLRTFAELLGASHPTASYSFH